MVYKKYHSTKENQPGLGVVNYIRCDGGEITNNSTKISVFNF